jgi:hypothetical protein
MDFLKVGWDGGMAEDHTKSKRGLLGTPMSHGHSESLSAKADPRHGGQAVTPLA